MMKIFFKRREIMGPVLALAIGIFLVSWGLFGHRETKKIQPPLVDLEPLADSANSAASGPRANPKALGKGVNPARPSLESTPREAAGCYTQNYQHRPTAGHEDPESCAQHDNVVALDPAIVSTGKAFCVRIDGVAVVFERKKDKILIGPLAGPQSVVSVSYCLGKSTCLTPCLVPKDGFMNAIGAGEDVAPTAPAVLVNWDPKDADSARDVSADLQLDDGNAPRPQFKDWTLGAKRPGCSTTLVSIL